MARRLAVLVLISVLGCVAAVAPASASTRAGEHTETIFVGNNWEGTADIIRLSSPPGPQERADAVYSGKPCKKHKAKKKKHGKKRKKRCGKKRKKHRKRKHRGRAISTRDDGVTLTRLKRLNIIPDYNERMMEILTDPVRLAYFLAIREAIGEGNDQFVDDMYSSRDGQLLIVSRPSFRDVVGIRISTGEIVWRFVVDGQRSDHMGLSPDGKHVAVSASTANVVHILDTETGQEVGRFDSGDSPHENTYSADGHRIYHASIGLVYTPLDEPAVDTTKGERYFQVVNADDNSIIKRIDMGQKLEDAGYPNMSSAVRPMTITPDESFVYLQVSFFHGYVEYDNVHDQVTDVVNLPNLVPDMPKEQYLLDSAHHGISLNGAADTLCVAGTMDDYAAVVSRFNPSDYTLIKAGTKPYWVTRSDDGRYCYISWSGSDKLSVIDYAKRKEVASIQVGDHPQRVRTGSVAAGAL